MKTALFAVAFAALARASPITIILDLGNVAGNEPSQVSGGDASPFSFTSTFNVVTTAEEVVDNDNVPTGGLPGCTGTFNYGINSVEEIICYNITIQGFQGDFESPATSATHIHEAGLGLSGPPRIAFPNPLGEGLGPRSSIGCLKGPFLTGILVDGQDTGAGFTLRQIEENPAAFFTDVHSSVAVPGATRGQLGSAPGVQQYHIAP